MQHLIDAVKCFRSDHSPKSEERIKNEIRWLLSGNSDPIDDAISSLDENDITVEVALDLHDIISESGDLSNEEKTKLHFAINLKVTRV